MIDDDRNVLMSFAEAGFVNTYVYNLFKMAVLIQFDLIERAANAVANSLPVMPM